MGVNEYYISTPINYLLPNISARFSYSIQIKGKLRPRLFF
jgi:hypothetical protein